MIWLLLMFAASVGAFVWVTQDYDRPFYVAVASVTLALVSGILLLGAAVERGNFTGAAASIEQLREDVAGAPCIGTDVVGQVTTVNQTIRSKQAYNKTWYAGAVTPNAWDGVKVISVEVCK